MTTTSKKTRRRPAAAATRSRRRPAARPPEPAVAPPKAAAPPAAVIAPPPEPSADGAAPPLPLPSWPAPEPAFAARALPPDPDRPLPIARRAIFFDVENTSRAQHVARLIEHLAVDRAGQRTEFVAVGNWRVIGHDTARLLAQHGAHLVHSVPAVGVRDWSDLRIAVTAGVWLAGARPGDVIEIVSDDRAFDAVGDVAASLGIVFRRLSYRGLGGAPGVEPAPRAPVVESEPRRGRGGRRHGGRRPGPPPPRPGPPPSRPVAAPAPSPVRHHPAAPAAESHTAPHDEVVAVARDLIEASPARSVTLDALANALKTRGFSRPPGSPRLITRLRRIRELDVSRAGLITLTEAGAGAEGPTPPRDEEPAPPRHEAPALAVPEPEPLDAEDPDDNFGNRAPGAPRVAPPAAPARHGRRRRGGRGRRGRGGRGQAPPA